MTDLDRIIAEMRGAAGDFEPWGRETIEGFADRLAALAGAAPVAWMAFGACTGEQVFSTMPPDEPNVAGWTPLFTHAGRARRLRRLPARIAAGRHGPLDRGGLAARGDVDPRRSVGLGWAYHH